MNRLAEIWYLAAKDLSIEVDGPVIVPLGDGQFVEADVVVRNFGGAKGMIVVDRSTQITGLSDAIVEAGFGFSVMGPINPNSSYDRDTLIEVLRDWGWSGPADGAPAWL